MSILSIKNLSVQLEDKKILSGINLELLRGKIHCLMGPNGSGKSTLAQVLMGHPGYLTTSGQISILGRNLEEKATDERARLGMFLAFQNPVAVPGVSVANLLRMALGQNHNGKGRSKHNPALNLVSSVNEKILAVSRKLEMPREFLNRGLNEEFSGGEKKKLEMLQALILSPKVAIFDEIDTGLDVDALRIVARGISLLKKAGCSILLITHYQRILKFAKPDCVHILIKGKLVSSGSFILARKIEKSGYREWLSP